MSTISVFDMFKIPLIHFKINDWNTKKQKLLSLKKFEGIPSHNTENLITDYHENAKVKYNYSDKVYDILKQEINQFLIQFRLPPYKISDSWIETTYNDMCHQVHNHGGIGFSAVCFVDFNPEHHKPTHFICPYNDFVTGSQQIFVPKNINEGSLILFPASLLHFTVPSYNSSKRTILSFNLR